MIKPSLLIEITVAFSSDMFKRDATQPSAPTNDFHVARCTHFEFSSATWFSLANKVEFELGLVLICWSRQLSPSLSFWLCCGLPACGVGLLDGSLVNPSISNHANKFPPTLSRFANHSHIHFHPHCCFTTFFAVEITEANSSWAKR